MILDPYANLAAVLNAPYFVPDVASSVVVAVARLAAYKDDGEIKSSDTNRPDGNEPNGDDAGEDEDEQDEDEDEDECRLETFGGQGDGG